MHILMHVCMEVHVSNYGLECKDHTKLNVLLLTHCTLYRLVNIYVQRVDTSASM